MVQSFTKKNISAPLSLTDNLWLHESVAVVTVASSGRMQAQHYLIPLSILTEMLDEKVYPLGVPPIMSFRPRHLHVMPLHQSGSQEDSLKHVAPRMMTRLAKQLPWDHPIARTLNHEVHRRKMAGKSCRFFH